MRRSAVDAGYDVTLELDADATLTSPLLPGFEVRLGSLFAR